MTTWAGDANWDESLARGYNRSIERVYKASGKDARFKTMSEESERILIDKVKDVGNLTFKQARRKYTEKDYKGARAPLPAG